ncbi:hypothetical protein NEOC65_000672 [Neochlamydia sp. AcF65]|nr:hypothetical protein [Neochlamydia sp. AcF65]
MELLSISLSLFKTASLTPFSLHNSFQFAKIISFNEFKRLNKL